MPLGSKARRAHVLDGWRKMPTNGNRSFRLPWKRLPTSFWLFVYLVATLGAGPQDERVIDGRPSRVLENDKIALTVRSLGGVFSQITLKDDAEQVNPLQGLGHFVCVDGFGPVSAEERAAGLPSHGEAHRVPWDLVVSEKKDGVRTMGFSAVLPIVHETFRRTLRLVDGEQVIYVDSELENLLGFDRPINWGEHATIGGPFLEQGRTTTEMSSKRAMTRSYESEAVTPPDNHRLADAREFAWPMAPGADGVPIDVRVAPTVRPMMDQTASLMDESRPLQFVAAWHPDKRMLIGYVFKRAEYPWLQIWDSYPALPRSSSRGMEFATEPFDLPRRDVIDARQLFGTPTYRWLPAQSTIRSSFVIFYTRMPEGFDGVADVTIANGTLTVTDRKGGALVLAASRGL
jgi:hypothetical protein